MSHLVNDDNSLALLVYDAVVTQVLRCFFHVFSAVLQRYFFEKFFTFFSPRDYPTSVTLPTHQREKTLRDTQLKLGKLLKADYSLLSLIVSIFKINIFFLSWGIQRILCLIKQLMTSEQGPELRSVRMCLHSVQLRFLFPCNSSVLWPHIPRPLCLWGMGTAATLWGEQVLRCHCSRLLEARSWKEK